MIQTPNSLQDRLREFLDAQLNPSLPVLLAFSGGPDSLALLHAVLEYKQRHPLDLHLAHVDHGWREESANEALQLKALAENQGLLMHLMRITNTLEGNLEAASRQKRLEFFRKLSRKYNYQAVLLAHHADDQAETVLKSVLEGKSLPYLKGMRPIAEIEGLTLWRPWLSVTKKEILHYLEKKGLIPLDDRTNRDCRYLRARFRTQIFPELSEHFGKEITPTLCRLASEARELDAYLEKRLMKYLAGIQTDGFGLFLDMSETDPLDPFEMKYLLRKMGEKVSLPLGKDAVEEICSLFDRKAADRQIKIGNQAIFVDRDRVFIPNKALPTLRGRQLLNEGPQRFGPWDILMETASCPTERTSIDWRQAWKGQFTVTLPRGNYAIGDPKCSPEDWAKLNKWWSNAKVPAFFRYSVPILLEGDSIKCEFLTGRDFKPSSQPQCEIKLLFTFEDSCFQGG